MTFEARQEFVDSHFMGLCLFALWADGSLSINERQFLADVVWFMSEKDEALSYDFDFFVRSKLVNTIKVIEETYPSLNTEKGSADVSSVIDALKEIVIRLDSLLDVILVEVDEKHVEDARKGIFRNIVQSYVGLALCDGNLDERERKILRGVERQVPSSVFDVSGFVSDSGLYDLSPDVFLDENKSYIANGMGDYVKKRHMIVCPHREIQNVFYPYLIDNITRLEARAKIDALDDSVRFADSASGPKTNETEYFVIEVENSDFESEIPPTEVVKSLELVDDESDHAGLLMVRNYSLVVVRDEEEPELSPRETLIQAIVKGYPFIAPAFRFTSYDKEHGMILQQHSLLPWDEDRTPLNYPEDYFQICLNEVDEEIVDILGDGLSQVGVATGSYENSGLMTFEFDSNGQVKLAQL